MTCEQRAAAIEERILSIAEALRQNTDPSEVAALLAEHYQAVSRESIKGFSPRTDLRDYWFKFYLAYQALSRKCKKIEEKQ